MPYYKCFPNLLISLFQLGRVLVPPAVLRSKSRFSPHVAGFGHAGALVGLCGIQDYEILQIHGVYSAMTFETIYLPM